MRHGLLRFEYKLRTWAWLVKMLNWLSLSSLPLTNNNVQRRICPDYFAEITIVW